MGFRHSREFLRIVGRQQAQQQRRRDCAARNWFALQSCFLTSSPTCILTKTGTRALASKSYWGDSGNGSDHRPAWSEEWKRLGLGATLVDAPQFPAHLFFVQMGFGVDQHGDDKTAATKAAIRAVRNAIEFNSIPGVITHVPGGRKEMLIHVKLGIPPRVAVDDSSSSSNSTSHKEEPLPIDILQVAKVFPYGKLLPFEICVGGLSFPTGRIVEELGDTNDVAICVAACVSIGYGDPTSSSSDSDKNNTRHKTYSTKDGY